MRGPTYACYCAEGARGRAYVAAVDHGELTERLAEVARPLGGVWAVVQVSSVEYLEATVAVRASSYPNE